jgi:uncharacterized membrane protein
MKDFFYNINKRLEEFSDLVAEKASSPIFLICHIVFWAAWILLKIEPFPYGLLTLIVSLESIILAGLLLSSGSREGEQEKKIARKDLRISTETNIMVEEIRDIMNDIQEDIRDIKDLEE